MAQLAGHHKLLSLLDSELKPVIASIYPAIDLARTFGTRPFVVTGGSRERTAAFVSTLSAETFAVSGEPTVDLVCEGTRRAKDAGCDVVISIGGGSVIDAGKAIAIIATDGGEPFEFLEVVGKGRAITVPPLPHDLGAALHRSQEQYLMKHFLTCLGFIFCLAQMSTSEVLRQSGDTTPKPPAPVAYVYIGTAKGVVLFDAASNGSLTQVAGSPFQTTGLAIGSNGSYFITLGTGMVG